MTTSDDDESDDDDDDDDTGGDDTGPVDADGDGWSEDEDCDDGDASTHPGATESCDGLDNDCDGVVGAEEIDDDGDGQSDCEGDCDDTDPEVYVGRLEVPDNGIDDNCNGHVDEDFVDMDGDGWSDEDDCDDHDSGIHPGAMDTVGDLVDQNYDGVDGVSENDYTGYAVSASDVNGDGLHDLLLGACGNDEGGEPGGPEVPGVQPVLTATGMSLRISSHKGCTRGATHFTGRTPAASLQHGPNNRSPACQAPLGDQDDARCRGAETGGVLVCAADRRIDAVRAAARDRHGCCERASHGITCRQLGSSLVATSR